MAAGLDEWKSCETRRCSSWAPLIALRLMVRLRDRLNANGGSGSDGWVSKLRSLSDCLSGCVD